jgi:hypothetical protein
MSLSEAAMLVSLNINQWSARKYDRQVSKEVCETKGADQNSGNFNKQLIPKLNLKDIQRVVNAARNYHYLNTLAWDHDGADLLPAKHYITYSSELSKFKNEFEHEVSKFVDEYPSILTNVMNNLAGLYNSNDYPSQERIKSKFNFEVNITPIPDVADFRIDINKKDMDKLKQDLGNRLEAANAAAEKDLFMRLYTTIAKAYMTLNTPDKIFRNSLILNIVELVQKIPDMNFNNDEQLNQIAKDVSAEVRIIDIEDLRKNKTYRRRVASNLEKDLKEIDQVYTDKWSGE